MKAVFFDLDDTLYDQLQPFSQAYHDHFALYDIPIPALYQRSRVHSDTVFHDTEAGTISVSDMHHYRIQQAMADFGYQITSTEAAAFQKSYFAYQQKITLLDDVRATLNLCYRSNITMGIITNGPSAHQRMKIKQLALQQWIPENRIFISSEQGIAKPNKKLFLKAARDIQASPNELLYVGDSYQNDIMGAKAAGWQVIWLNRRQNVLPENQLLPDMIVEPQDSLLEKMMAILSH